MKTKDVLHFDAEYEKAYQLGLTIIKNEAIQIMRLYPKYVRFVMAMGTYFFVEEGIHKGKKYKDNIDDAPCMKQLNKFIDRYNSELKFTGEGICIYQDGTIIDKW